jgi:hypothetical protein
MQFFDSQEDEMVTVMLQTCVFPLYSMSSPNPYLLANANWLLGELATCLPEDLSDDVFNSLTKALLAPDASGISWQPVRASAAGTLSLLLQVLYFIIMASTPAGFEIIITGFELIRN